MQQSQVFVSGDLLTNHFEKMLPCNKRFYRFLFWNSEKSNFSKKKIILIKKYFLFITQLSGWSLISICSIFTMSILLRMIAIIFTGRRIVFNVWIEGYVLRSHVIKTLSLPVTFTISSLRSACQKRCIIVPLCVSVNVGPVIKDRFICELSDSDHNKHYKDMIPREGFMYMGTEVMIYLHYIDNIFFWIWLLDTPRETLECQGEEKSYKRSERCFSLH